MLQTILLAVLLCFVSVQAQNPTPCIAPSQFHARASLYDHQADFVNRYIYIYDAANRRRVLFEEMDVGMPGQKFYVYMEFANENVMYQIDIKSRECTKSIPRPWRPIGIPGNATFEGEMTLGGPGESFVVQEWSDKIPYRHNAMFYIQFSLVNCYPIKMVEVSDNNVTNSVTTTWYDLVEGIPNPNDFIVPKECQTAKWEKVMKLTHK
ncbi:mammalian ependymin-related protein 1-like [Mizuhopecten yessoensis]|uniref:Mammalian ependymin-related protein 1 n=1 Tax=Mizuhopecten yessoensis TaxID=6573 RepID=A0A210Q132_MIZYE|nr:mammalian ependymin-related protein 1-like [Mizuhopecten yessoensis]OWF42415.1 Mammalian ependymin-related protein 1 [Mizuhopecten yessoensis]